MGATSSKDHYDEKSNGVRPELRSDVEQKVKKCTACHATCEDTNYLKHKFRQKQTVKSETFTRGKEELPFCTNRFYRKNAQKIEPTNSSCN